MDDHDAYELPILGTLILILMLLLVGALMFTLGRITA